MSNVLFLVHRIPFPPDKGDKIRSYHLLKFLAREHNVYLGAFVDSPEDRQYLPELDEYCAEVFLRPAGGWRSRMGALLALSRGRSLSVGYYRDRPMKRWVAGLSARMSFDAVIAFSSTTAQYLPLRTDTGPVLIADYVDVDSDKWRQYAAESRWPRSWLYRYEARALSKWEANVLETVDAVTVVSRAESKIVPGLTDANRHKLRVVANGVDLDYFDPDADWPDPYGGNRQSVVFTGAMDYYANEDGVCWFATEVWPTILARCPYAQFHIVGSNPTAAVSALSEQPGISVTGRVPDVRPYLRHAGVAIAPLRLARGVQNKVLEALAMGRPVVAKPAALRGLDGTLPTSAMEAASAADFAQSVISSLELSDRAAGAEGRMYVRENYDWPRNLRRIGALIPAAPEVRVGEAAAVARVAG